MGQQLCQVGQINVAVAIEVLWAIVVRRARRQQFASDDTSMLVSRWFAVP